MGTGNTADMRLFAIPMNEVLHTHKKKNHGKNAEPAKTIFFVVNWTL